MDGNGGRVGFGGYALGRCRFGGRIGGGWGLERSGGHCERGGEWFGGLSSHCRGFEFPWTDESTVDIWWNGT